MQRFVHGMGAAVVAAGVALFSSGAAAAEPRYRVQDLSRLVGLDEFSVTDLNDRGDMTLLDTENRRGYLWRDGRLTDLGAWSGGTLALNERGDVAGTRTLGDGRRVPFLWRDGRFTNLADSLGAGSGSAWGVNESGQVVGEADGRAFVYDGTRSRYLDIPDATASTALAINDRGEIVGGASYPRDNLQQRAFIDRHGWTQVLQEPIVYDWDGDYRATALNNQGNAVVRWFDGNWGESGSALYMDGIMVDLGYGTYARDINNHNLAAGYSVVEVDWDEYEFTALLFQDGRTVNLNRVLTAESDARWEWLETISALNDKGQVVGIGRLADGREHVFLASAVPEASGAWTLLAGLGGLLVAVQAKRSRRDPQAAAAG